MVHVQTLSKAVHVHVHACSTCSECCEQMSASRAYLSIVMKARCPHFMGVHIDRLYSMPLVIAPSLSLELPCD